MNVLKEKCANGLVTDYLESIICEVENLFQCDITSFSMVLENESGHCVISKRKGEEE